MRITRIATAAVSVVLCGAQAEAAARVVILPVAVGANADPSPELLVALERGLHENASWNVVQGEALKGLLSVAPGLKPEDRARLSAKLDEGAEKIAKAPKEAAATLEAVRAEMAADVKDQPLADSDLDLLYRAGGLLVAAAEPERAKAVAAEVVAQFPGRKPTDADKLPPTAVERLTAASPVGGVKLTLKTRPEACEVRINGTAVGTAPVEIAASPGVTYQAQAVCPSGGTLKSFPKIIAIGDKETARQEVLDADFERAFQAEGGQRLRFASGDARRQLEDGAARRVADRYGADVVVLASVGELSGADWLNARLYLRSGYLNRQGLVRLEAGRALALGRYLATGRETPGVLKPEEAGALAAASQPPVAQARHGGSPWYTDVVGWCFAGVGAFGVTLGILENKAGQRKSDEADAVRGDSERQQALYQQAQRSKFIGNIGLIGGGLMAVTGVVLLAIPEYSGSSNEQFVFVPTPGGGAVAFSGRF